MSTIAQTSPATHITGIDVLTRKYSDARAAVSGRVSTYQEELRALQKRHIPAIKQAAGIAAQRQAELQAELTAHPELFVKPRTITLHGIKVGYQKGKGQMLITDEERSIALIRKFLPDRAEVLIKSKESVVRAVASELPVADLRRIGIEIVDTGDSVFIRAVDGDIEKLVTQLLEEGAKDE